jgi:hypothetical protein
MAICDLKHVLEVGGAVLAILAAGLWFISAWYGSKPLTYNSMDHVVV